MRFSPSSVASLEGTCESLDRSSPAVRTGSAAAKAVVLLQIGGTEPDPALKNVAFVLDLARNEAEKQAVRFLYAGQGFGTPLPGAGQVCRPTGYGCCAMLSTKP